MTTSFAAVIFRPDQVTDRALSHGFAVALAGYDAPAPSLLVGELRGLPGWAAAFYRSGAKGGAHTEYEELDHATELFEQELPPALCVRDAAVEAGSRDAVVYAILFTDEALRDDAWRFAEGAIERRYAREGEEGPEAGVETLEGAEVTELDLELSEDATDAEERAAVERAAAAHRGSAFLTAELGAPVLGALFGALFAPDRKVAVRLLEATPAAIAAEVDRLNRSLRRAGGRGAPAPAPTVAGVAPPAAYAAFARAYDWEDPADPQDLYRELALGKIEGTLHFLRPKDLEALSIDPGWARAASRGAFPLAALRSGALGGGARSGDRVVALAPDGERLLVVAADGRAALAGPTFAELLRYLALGWKQRDAVEEDLIGALMLRAKVVSEAGGGPPAAGGARR